MDLAYPAEADGFRATIRDFLDQNLPDDWRGVGALGHDEHREFCEDWRLRLHEAGFLAVNWPKEYGGGGLSPLEVVVLAEEFAKVGAPLSAAPNDGYGIGLLGNTLLAWATEEQKRHYLPRILSREDIWCQGYSEPEAGSDLANLKTRATLDGNEWVINGQKLWTSEAHHADHIFMLVRTDPGSTRHHGISLLLVPMEQPGIQVRPILNIAGSHDFNEVFFDNARTAVDNVVGGVGNGWKVAMTLLGFERGAAVAYTSTAALAAGQEVQRLIELARQVGKHTDPVIRQRIAWCFSKAKILRYLNLRSLSSLLGTTTAGPEAFITKVFTEEYHQAVTELAVDILGGRATAPSGFSRPHLGSADPLGTPNSSASWVSTFLMARAGTIYGGASQIQRNIIGERALGLPREPRPQLAGNKPGPGGKS